eukprot:12907035-Prorocentrum_lima.AAC.1
MTVSRTCHGMERRRGSLVPRRQQRRNVLGAPVDGNCVHSAPRQCGVSLPRLAGQAHSEDEGMPGQHQRGEQ